MRYLPIANGAIIKAHGGKIKAENKKNGGALFRFYLDMEEKEQA